MKRLVLVLVPLAVVLSACALPVVKPPTYVSDKGAVFNGDVYSSGNGDVEYRWGLSFENGGGATSTHTVTVADQKPEAVSTPFPLLNPSTTYQLTLCAKDYLEDPRIEVCSKPFEFQSPPAGGRSGIAYQTSNGISIMDADGGNKTPIPNTSSATQWPSWSPDATKLVVEGSLNGVQGIIRMNADGSNKVNIAPMPTGYAEQPAWSPDGAKIAYTANHPGQGKGIWTMNTDGSDKKKLVSNESPETRLAWRPDGQKIAYSQRLIIQGDPNAHNQIFVMDRDGSNYVNITDDLSKNDFRPAWSPDGTKIIFEAELLGLWTMNPDGSNRTPLSTIFGPDRYASWSPAGNKIAFVSYRSQLPNEEIWKMDANGANQVALTNGNSGWATRPAWSPRP